MATVNFKLLTKKNPSNIYCRFSHSREIVLCIRTGVFINPAHWDNKHQKIKNVLAVKNRDEINRKLSQLKIDVIDDFNLSYMNGEIIDSDWLKNTISDFFGRPKHEKEKQNLSYATYYVDFADWWLKEKSKTWLTTANSYMNDRTKSQYESFVSLTKQFQGRKKIKLSDSGSETITDFVHWLNDGGYAEKTIKRHVNRFKFFFLRAKEEGYKIDPTFEKRVFVPKSEEVLEPILNEVEINTIFNLKLESEVLDNARDNLIIACWTGLRVSDYLNKLDISNFIDDFIEIKTTKTKTRVTIPVHPIIKKILIKHNGNLPKKVNDADFNKQIKEVCKKAGLKKEIKGRIYDKESKRKVLGLYPKYKLITSHIGRRSFATNLFGKLPNSVIMSICGWSKEEMMLSYIKKSNREDAVQLKKYWEETYKNN